MKRAILILLAAVAASEVLAARLDVDGPSTSAMNGSNALDRVYAQARATDAAKTGSNYTVTVSSAAAKAGTNYADAVKGYCRNAANLTNSVPLAQITNAIAQLRSPQVVTYSCTNVYTDARLGTLFRVYVTNDFRLHAPTGPADGQTFKYWFVQWVGGTNTITTVASEFLPPEGASGMPVLSVSNLWNDVWLGTWDARINKVRIESFMRYRE